MTISLPHGRLSEAEGIRVARECLEASQFFCAYDVAREALNADPSSLHLKLMAAHALFRCGALQEASRMLEELEPSFESREQRIRRTASLLHAAARSPQPEDPSVIESLAMAMGALAQPSLLEQLPIDLVQLMSETYQECWERLGDENALKQARDLQQIHYDTRPDLTTGAQTAVLSWCLGDRDSARRMAAETARRFPPADAADPGDAAAFHGHLQRGQLALIRGAADRADAHLAAAAAAARHRYPLRVTARRELRLLARHGIPEAETFLDRFPPPRVVIFSGQAIHCQAAPSPWFPEAMEGPVREAIQQQLASLNADIGYCSAAAGADILFMESMLERGADVHVILPFKERDFFRHRVAPAGYRWEFRAKNAMKAAASVVQVSEDRYLGDDLILRFGNQVIDGTARLQAALLETAPYLMSVYDYAAPAGPGTTADFIDCWGDPMRLCIIDLDGLRQAHGMADPDAEGAAAIPPPASDAPPQQICAMLFADIVGFSKIQDQYLGALWEYIDTVRQHIEGRHTPPLLVESWGDALYVAMDSATAMATYAHLLTSAFNDIDARDHGLPVRLSLRIGLHAGPVFHGMHPLTGRPIIYGGNVNRAARIEPISVAGHIYASQQFVALLTAEQSAVEAEAAFTGDAYHNPFICEYKGVLALAKAHGDQAIYMLHAAPPTVDAGG